MLAGLRGKVAIANAKLAYQRYKRLFAGPRWEKLRAQGAREQRLLWASTGTKNPAYSDVLYVEELIGPTRSIPFRRQPWRRFAITAARGRASRRMSATRSGPWRRWSSAASRSMTVTATLVDEGVALFAEAFDKLLGAVARKRAARLGEELNAREPQAASDTGVRRRRRRRIWRRDGNLRRLWSGDARAVDRHRRGQVARLARHRRRRAQTPRRALAPCRRYRPRRNSPTSCSSAWEARAWGRRCSHETFGRQHGRPELLVLDSTDPAQIRTFESKIDPARTLFIVSSKSGSTLEPNILKRIFLRVRQAGGRRR